ncbi:hypothetical protein MPDQ_008019 [Monascus purpureus]|uniref:Uncharacterized protein n=1 Tax=Monascus purpureus TaxID=5098 RepID=A0A507QT77_MONPU|nr:hypothetical protein MPDQ_008019 [Monascus purpureus]BDD58752.1 hypothetical protein MAP00_004005 [Monascus purpureus]
MNTIRSTWVGWGVLCVAGGGAYYYAKKSINADRSARYESEIKRKAQLAAQEAEFRRKSAQIPKPTDDPSLKRANLAQQAPRDDTASPSTEAARDPAPTRHDPLTETERVSEKGKYEAAEPFRPPKGNRFS